MREIKSKALLMLSRCPLVGTAKRLSGGSNSDSTLFNPNLKARKCFTFEAGKIRFCHQSKINQGENLLNEFADFVLLRFMLFFRHFSFCFYMGIRIRSGLLEGWFCNKFRAFSTI